MDAVTNSLRRYSTPPDLMKTRFLPLLSALLVSLPPLAIAAGVRIYQLDLAGPAPEVARVREALDEKRMVALVVHSGTVEADGTVLIDETRPDFSTPVPAGEEPPRTGLRVEGKLTAAGKESPRRDISLLIWEWKHTGYLYAPKLRKFTPLLSSSKLHAGAEIGEDGWGLIDTDPKAKETRKVYVVQVTE